MSMHARLREAILDLDTVNYPRLYQTNAEFHNAIETLVRVVGPLTRMLADQAIENDLVHRQTVDTLSKLSPEQIQGLVDGPARDWAADELQSGEGTRQTIVDYLEMYRNQVPQQAQLVVPAWAKRQLDALPEEERQSILQELDGIAAQHGLNTPVNIIEGEGR